MTAQQCIDELERWAKSPMLSKRGERNPFINAHLNGVTEAKGYVMYIIQQYKDILRED